MTEIVLTLLIGLIWRLPKFREAIHEIVLIMNLECSCRAKNQVSERKAVFLWFQELKCYCQPCLMKEKTLLSMKKIWNLRKIILLIMFFVVEFFLTVASYQFFVNDWIFINNGSFIFFKCCFLKSSLNDIRHQNLSHSGDLKTYFSQVLHALKGVF